MGKPGSFKEKCAIYVQDGYILVMMREETGNRNCLGVISLVKDSDFSINYNEKSSNECQNKNDKNTFMLQNNYSG